VAPPPLTRERRIARSVDSTTRNPVEVENSPDKTEFLRKTLT
jgi:hypothetical protein